MPPKERRTPAAPAQAAPEATPAAAPAAPRPKLYLRDLGPGDSAWIKPQAVAVNSGGDMEVDPDCPFRLTPDLGHVVRVEVKAGEGGDGVRYEVDRRDAGPIPVADHDPRRHVGWAVDRTRDLPGGESIGPPAPPGPEPEVRDAFPEPAAPEA
jgi:hypothetical protein